MIKKTIAIAALAVASAGVMAETYTIVRVAPPAPIVEVAPSPRHGYVWAPGFYDYRHGNYTWVRGHWERERRGYEFREARWVQTGNGEWRRVGGSWERGRHGDRDHERMDNRDDNNNRSGMRPNGDRDGDGVRNQDDRRPNNPNRS